MAGGINADISSLAQTGGQFGAAADQLQAIAEQLGATLDGLGDFWGGDDVGTAFAGKYVGPRDVWMSQAGVAGGQGLPAVSDTVNSWAQLYSDRVQNEADTMSGFAGTVDGI